MNSNDLLNLYRFLRREGSSFASAVRELSSYFGRDESVIIKYLLKAEP